jgi:putative tricarboxylic transport membrane protein
VIELKKYLFEACLVVLSVSMLFNIRKWSFIKTYIGMGSETWPVIVLAAIILLSALQVFLSAFGDKASSISFENLTVQVLLAMGLLAGYIYSLEYIGFLVGTLLFQWIFIALINQYKNKLYAFAPILVTVSIFFLFVKIMYVPLPRGMGLFRTFSSFFY